MVNKITNKLDTYNGLILELTSDFKEDILEILNNSKSKKEIILEDLEFNIG
jgi:hypothetical protein